MPQIPTIGRIVHFTLDDQTARAINIRRFDAERARPWDERNGVMVHVGNEVKAGDVFPMVITRVWEERHEWSDPFCSEYDGNVSPSRRGVSCRVCSGKFMVNGQVMLDGNDLLWVTSRSAGEEEGQWSWPVMQTPAPAPADEPEPPIESTPLLHIDPTRLTWDGRVPSHQEFAAWAESLPAGEFATGILQVADALRELEQ